MEVENTSNATLGPDHSLDPLLFPGDIITRLNQPSFSFKSGGYLIRAFVAPLSRSWVNSK